MSINIDTTSVSFLPKPNICSDFKIKGCFSLLKALQKLKKRITSHLQLNLHNVISASLILCYYESIEVINIE